MNLFDKHSHELGTTDIANTLDLPKSTVAGLIYTLEANGYLEQNLENRKYRLGARLAELGGVFLSRLEIRKVALPHLEGLAKWCGESVILAERRDAEMVTIECLFGEQRLGMWWRIGERDPLHSTALGKAIMSKWAQDDLGEFLAEHTLSPVTTRTITDSEVFAAELQASRERGYAIENEENEIGGRSIAAAILDHTGRPLAAVAVSGPAARLFDSRIPEIGEKALETASMISSKLGFVERDID